MRKSIKPKRWFFEKSIIIDKLLARLRIKIEARHKLSIPEMEQRLSFDKVTEYYIKNILTNLII